MSRASASAALRVGVATAYFTESVSVRRLLSTVEMATVTRSGATFAIVAIVDAKTASSAEVLAAALHDNCRARVVGKTTYGKGVIQARG